MAQPEELESSLTVKRTTTASRDRVWEVIADGWTYSQWVVGNSRMRAVDPEWPEPGSTIRHSVGVWPVLLDDSTVSVECIPGEKLVMIANGRPFGKARITLVLSDVDGGGCRIEMAEVPITPPLNWLPKRASLAAAFPRNRECTWRLAALAERKLPKDLPNDE